MRRRERERRCTEYVPHVLPPATLRVAIYDTEWHVTDTVTVSSTTGQSVLQFPAPAKTGVISVKRLDTGEVVVGYEVS